MICEGRNIEPEKFTDQIIVMSMVNDIAWTRKGNDGIFISSCETIPSQGFCLGSLLVTLVCSVVSLGELPTASPP